MSGGIPPGRQPAQAGAATSIPRYPPGHRAERAAAQFFPAWMAVRQV